MKIWGKIAALLVVVLCLNMALLVGCDKNEDELPITPATDDTPHFVLSNKDATESAKRLYDYIGTTYKHKILSGQQESYWIDSNSDFEMDYLLETTGKLPAIRGLDFIEDDFANVVTRSKAWAAKGGIVTICWHCSSKFDGGYNDCKADELTDAEWDAMLTDGTPENVATLAAMDKAGRALLELQTADIPVLWRPFHEFDGDWFWWSKGDKAAEHFKKLWVMMYDHFTNDLHLNNLIWVLGYSFRGDTDNVDYYPGDEYCDIVGGDSYYTALLGAEERLFDAVYGLIGDRKPITLHEVGYIPTVEELKEVPWTWFMTWHTTYLTQDNKPDELSAVYNSDYVITLDELPPLYE